MHPTYPLIEEVLRHHSDQAVLNLSVNLQENTGDSCAAFGCGENQQYVLQRLISACLSSDPEIKFNSYLALQVIAQQTTALLKVAPVLQYVLAQSDYKKHCGGKIREIEAYAIGRILVVKAFESLFRNNPDVIQNLLSLAQQFPAF